MAARHLADNDLGSAAFGGAKYDNISEGERQALLAEILPHLRGMVSQENRFIGTVQYDADILSFVNSVDAARLAELGTSCPDHFLRTKIKPLYVDWDPAGEDSAALLDKLRDGIAQYRLDYAAYYEACKRPDSPPMRDANPTVILIPGLGMIAFGKNKSESRVTAEFYNCAVAVMRGAEAVGGYVALPRQEAFDIEYWALEEAKLRRMPPEKTLARKVVIVVGAGSGIGVATAQRVAAEGAHVVCADLNYEGAQATADALTQTYGPGIGVAGSGISGCGPAIAAQVDITSADSVQALLERAVLAYGGVDDIIVTAGVFFTPDADGGNSAEQWRTSFEVNVRGGYLVAQGARPIWQAQAAGRFVGADDKRQWRGGQGGLHRLRHQQSRRQPPRARAGDRAGAAGARERPGAGHSRQGQQHVPARPRHQFADQVRPGLPAKTKTRKHCARAWRVSTQSAR